MNLVWLPLSVVLGIAGFYVFLALYLLCRLFGAWAVGTQRPRSTPQPSLPAWMPPPESLDRHKDSTIQA